MNGAVIFSNESWPGNDVFCVAQSKAPAGEETMTGAMMAFGIAVGVATLICYLLMTRLQKRRVVSGSPRDGFGWVGGGDIGDGGSHFVWSENDNSATVHSDAASDCGGGDSGGGGGSD
jgi:hypothetical protein